VNTKPYSLVAILVIGFLVGLISGVVLIGNFINAEEVRSDKHLKALGMMETDMITEIPEVKATRAVTVVGKKFFLTDNDGKVKVTISVDSSGSPSITLRDKRNENKITISDDALVIRDNQGRMRSFFSWNNEARHPSLIFIDKDKKPRVWLDEDGLHFGNKKQGKGYVLTMPEGQKPSLVFRDDDGNKIWNSTSK